MEESFIPYRLAGAYLKGVLAEEAIPLPCVGIICGSGLSGLSKALEGQTLSVKYSDIPGFPEHCTVAGHKGEVVFGMLSNVPAMCFRGRFHSYEGHDMRTTVLPVRVMRCLGVKLALITNAAGSLNPSYNVGDIVCASDHLAIPQLVGRNPLVGPNDNELGPRFPPTSNAYPKELRDAVHTAAKEIQIDFVVPTGGTYCFVSGPMYESRAECKFLRSVGGDCAGMSTVPEIVAAHHSGMKVLCLSLITNKIVVDENDKQPAASHQEVLEAVQNRSEQMQQLVKQIVAVLGREILPSLPALPEISLEIPRKKTEKTHLMCTGMLIGIGAVLGGLIVSTMQRRR